MALVLFRAAKPCPVSPGCCWVLGSSPSPISANSRPFSNPFHCRWSVPGNDNMSGLSGRRAVWRVVSLHLGLSGKQSAVLFSTCPAPRTCVHNQRLGCPQEERRRAFYGSTPQSNTQHREAPLGTCKGQEWGLESGPTHLRQLSL